MEEKMIGAGRPQSSPSVVLDAQVHKFTVTGPEWPDTPTPKLLISRSTHIATRPVPRLTPGDVHPPPSRSVVHDAHRLRKSITAVPFLTLAHGRRRRQRQRQNETAAHFSATLL